MFPLSSCQDVSFGIPVPTSLDSYSYVNTSYNNYFLLNTEFTKDENVTAIEYYLTNAGYIEFWVIIWHFKTQAQKILIVFKLCNKSRYFLFKFFTWNTTALGGKVADITTSTGNFPQNWLKSEVVISSSTSQIGYNKDTLPTPTVYPKGSMVYAYATSGAKYAVNTQSPGIYNDYEYDRASLFNTSYKMALFANVIVSGSGSGQSSSNHTTAINSVSKSYSAAGSYTLTTSFTCAGLTYSKSEIIVVTDGKFYYHIH